MVDVSAMNAIFDQVIKDYHVHDDVDQVMVNPFEKGSLSYLLYHKCWIDAVQWHLEDLIRDPEINPVKALEIKRRIDSSNQDRTDKAGSIDDFFVEQVREVVFKEDARINTESPAWAIDRLSILALKIYHMQEQADRTDTEEAQRQSALRKLDVLLVQRKDLTQAITELLQDIQAGNRLMKVYRQMKMYNDPAMNPVLYKGVK